MTKQRWLRLCGAGAVAALAGCAPVVGPGFGPGLQIGITPTTGQLNVTTSACALTGSHTPETALSGSAQLFGRMQQVQALQARYALGGRSAQAQMQSWRRLGAGGC